MSLPDRDVLVERITQILVSELEGRGASSSTGCPECDAWGACPRHCLTEVRSALGAGAARAASAPGFACPADDGIRSRIDHTLLKPESTEDDIRSLCAEAKENCFASVCINPPWVSLCAELLAGTSVRVCTVVGFPLGSHLPEVKAFETRRAVQDGATEIDMVIDIGALKSKLHAHVARDVAGVVAAAGPSIVVKTILEMALLTEEEKVVACTIAQRAGADFVKTSTGFAKGGATVEDVRLMRRVVGPEMGVKASGGIRDTDAARAMLEAGATRLGTSASVAIVSGKKGSGDY